MGFFDLLSDPGQPVGTKIAAVLGAVLVLGLALFGAWWITIRLPSRIALGIVEGWKDPKDKGVIYDLALLKVDYDTARQEGFSAEDAIRSATDKAVARSKTPPQ